MKKLNQNMKIKIVIIVLDGVLVKKNLQENLILQKVKKVFSKLIFFFLRGSYYNNPQYDKPTEDKELIEKYPFYCAGNIWPKEELPELENAFKNLGQLVVSGIHFI